jgi:protein TIF31
LLQATSVEADDKSEESSVHTHKENDNSSSEILFNPNVFTEYKLDGSPEVFKTTLCITNIHIYLFDNIVPSAIPRKSLPTKSW